MTKRIKKIISMSFLIVFLLGYVTTIIPGSVLASLLDVKVYAEGEEEEEEPIFITTFTINHEDITPTISSNEMIRESWEDTSSFICDDRFEVINVSWENENGDPIDSTTPLNDSTKLYANLDLMTIQDEALYQFAEDINTDEIIFNDWDTGVVSYEYYDETDARIRIEVNVVSSGETVEVETLKVGSAALDYLAGNLPQFTARSLENSYYTVYLERFDEVGTDNFITSNAEYNTAYGANEDFLFQPGRTYSYTIWLRPVDTNNAFITNASSIEINGGNYLLTTMDEDPENYNAEIVDDDVLFYGVKNFEIAGEYQETLTINVLNDTNYNNGTFTFSDGTAYININGEKFTGELTQGNIVVNGNSATIEVVVTPNQGYTSEVQINGASQNNIVIDENSIVDIIFSPVLEEGYTLSFNTNGGSHLDDVTNNPLNTVIDLTNYVPTRQNYDFEGWYSDEGLENKITSITLDDNKTVYANWTLAVGEIALTYNEPEGLGAFSIGDSTVTTNTITGYITSNHKNTFRISPMFLEGWTVTSVVVTDAESHVTNAGPGEVNDDLVFDVNGSTSYNVVMTIEKVEQPQQTYTVTYMLGGLLSSNTATSITADEDYTTTLSVNPELELQPGVLSYALPNAVMVLIGDIEYEDVDYNPQTGTLTIPKLLINDNITIMAPAMSVIAKPVAGATSFTYDGTEKMLVVTGYNEQHMEVEGTLTATNAGNYSATYSLSSATSMWEDQTGDPVVFNWNINKANNNVSVSMDNWLFGSTPSEPVITGNYENANVLVQYKEKNASDSTYINAKPNYVGEFTVKVVIPETQNYLGGVAYDDFEITSDTVSVDLPLLVTKNYIYTGDEITVDVIYQSNLVNVSNNKATEIGTYQATFSLMNSNYEWADGTKEDKVLEWTIGLGVPEVTRSFTYNTTKLTMASVAGASGYQVFECNNKGAKCKQLAKSGSLVYTHKKRDFAKAYYYKVRAYTTNNDKTIYGDYTDLIKITTGLNAPVVKASQDRYQEVKLSWNKEDGSEKYYVDRCKEDGSGCKNIKVVTKNNFTDKSGKEGVTYKYRVRAFRKKKYSKYSELAEGLRLNDNLVVSYKNTAYLTNTINVKYKDGAVKYEVQKSTDNKKWTTLATFNVDENTEITEDGMTVIDNKKLRFNKKVYYRVRANNGVNYTAWNNKTITTSFVNPVTVSASINRYQEINLGWDKSSGAEKYYVYSCDAEGNKCKEIGTTKTNKYTDKKAKEGKDSYYRVKAFKAKKYSAFSNVAHGLRLNDDLEVRYTNTDYLTNEISIVRKEGAVKYEVQKSTDNKKWATLTTFDLTNEEIEGKDDLVYVDTKVSYNKKVYYRVRANNGVNYTAWNNKTISATKLKAPEVTTSGTIYHPTLNVNKVPQATGYEFYHSTDNETWTKVQKSTSTKFTKSFNEEETHYYRVRAYKTIDKKTTYYSDFTYISSEDFK